MSNWNDSNRNARIETRRDRNGRIRTETTRRDSGAITMAASTSVNGDSTKVYIDCPNGDVVSLDGRQARTLFRLLSAHYDATGKSFY